MLDKTITDKIPGNEVILMSKYCLTCYKEKVNNEAEDKDLVLSQEAAECECCGELKRIVMETVKSPVKTMTVAECQVETQKHIENVRKYIRFLIDKIEMRGVKHDASKLESPEVELFAEHTLQLASMGYGSDEYKASLEALKPALDHHYAANRHHPEHFNNGVNDMTLVDIIEMFCDWKASTLRHNDGNLLKSIELNAERFNMDGQLKQILVNTARMLDEHEQ